MVTNIPVTPYITLSHIDLVYASSMELRWIREVQHLARGISDHAPLSLTISLSKPPSLQLWHLSRYWALDTKIQDPLLEAICNYWIFNGESAIFTIMWDAFKSWVRGE